MNTINYSESHVTDICAICIKYIYLPYGGRSLIPYIAVIYSAC